LTLFILGDQVVGFGLFKIDKDDRPGLGYIMEFYIVPEQRRQGLGQKSLSLITNILTLAGCTKVWLASHNTAEAFWHACDFRETGEFERNQKVMIRSVDTKNNQPGKRR
jgi:ribosomal protein S18 acetylase RimI-like enzyme